MNNWKADFSGCLHAMPACCLATFGLGVGTALLQGLTFWEVNDGQGGMKECCLGLFLGSIGLALNRQKLRLKYQIAGSCPIDCLLYTLGCHCCLAVQEYREVRLHVAKI